MVGGGPAGSTCAAFCAEAGLNTLLIERSVFPRDKVCGDCLNPAAWGVLDRLGVSGRLLDRQHARLDSVEFVGLGGQTLRIALSEKGVGEIAIKRSLFDHILLLKAAERGAEVREGLAVSSVERGWSVTAGGETFESEVLVAGDGRNSTVTRLAGVLPAAKRDRISLQTHYLPKAAPARGVALEFMRGGYCGYCDVGGGEMNLCMVGRATQAPAMREWARQRFGVPTTQVWRTIAPLARAPVAPVPEAGLILVGDAARVLEPFTGEGIFYALSSGELAARSIIRKAITGSGDRFFGDYRKSHAKLYSGRLWINRIAREAVLHPVLGSLAVNAFRLRPAFLRHLTGRVLGAALVE